VANEKVYGAIKLQKSIIKQKSKLGIKEYDRYFITLPIEWVESADVQKGDVLLLSGTPEELKIKVQKG